MWNEMRGFRESDMMDNFSEDALDRAYEKGYKCGYKAAYKEVMSEQYGERGNYGHREGYGQRGGSYGHRDENEDSQDFGERRSRDSMGRYR